MINVAASQRRLSTARDIRGVLSASYDGFELIRAVVRHHQEEDQSAFAAFVLSGNAAANGRDSIAFAPSLPVGIPGATADVLDGASVTAVAAAMCALARDLAARLSSAAQEAMHRGDLTACKHAAEYAAEICGLLGCAIRT